MRRAAIAESNASITIPGTRVVVVGGTQGIGEGVAYRFAKAGAEVWIVGRNETKANAVLKKLEEISRQQTTDAPPSHQFIKADLSLISETKRVAADIRARAGPQGVNYLIMCQGGPPNGRFVLTSEGHEQHYAVQVLSRFILGYSLALEGESVVKEGVMSIMAPGKVFLKSVDHIYDDLDLVKANKDNKYGILAMVSRDSIVVDTFTEEFSRRKPSIAFTHVFPGQVKTDAAHNSSLPWYLSSLMKVALLFMGSTPESYADVPFYLLANPEGRATSAKLPYSDENLAKVEPHPSTQEKENKTKVWDHLMAVLNSSPRS